MPESVKIYKLPHGLRIDVVFGEDGGCRGVQAGGLSTTEDESTDPYEVAIATLEAAALAHACAGIDISDPKYIEGMATIYEKIASVWD